MPLFKYAVWIYTGTSSTFCDRHVYVSFPRECGERHTLTPHFNQDYHLSLSRCQTDQIQLSLTLLLAHPAMTVFQSGSCKATNLFIMTTHHKHWT